MKQKYWFPAKPPGYGWGWGLPQTWQGWLVFGSFFVFLILGAILLLPQRPLRFMFLTFALSALLIFICSRKGEPPGPIGGRR